MRKLIIWLLVAAAGFSIMAFSYFYLQYDTEPNLWQNAMMFIGKAQPAADTNGLDYSKIPVHLGPIPAESQPFLEIARSQGTNIEKFYNILARPKLFLITSISSNFTDQMLDSGRFPTPDSNEVLAGFETPRQDKITFDSHSFKIVGRLKRQISLFADSYLITAIETNLFDTNNVQDAYILRLQTPNENLTNRLEKIFPKSDFVTYAPLIRTSAAAFYMYLAGLTLLLCGGSFTLFQIYRIMALRIKDELLKTPLREITRHRRLFFYMHLIYFGTVILFSVIVYQLPQVQIFFIEVIKKELTSGPGPLAIAFKAYASKNILYAAAITFAVNFAFGSVLSITIPSFIIPGIGSVIAIFRASMWGMLLAPGFVPVSKMMLPHSLTLLLEGEGYILAAFFALLMAVYLFDKEKGPTPLHRYSAAFYLNLKGNLIVALVLAIAALYEAVEIIIAMP